jgi:hypothetical protein
MSDSSEAAASARLQRHRAMLAAAFEIGEHDIARDARNLLDSPAPRDELLASICVQHDWAAEMGVIYLAHLTRHVDPASGPMPSAWSTA